MAKDETLLETAEVRVRVMELAPGAATPWHYHREMTDQMVGLQGSVRVEQRGPDLNLTLTPGQRCRVEVGRTHRVANASPSEPASYLLIQGVGRYDFNPVANPD